MKTPRRKSKSQDIDQQTSSIPVGEAKALFDAVSQDNSKHITLGLPTEVVREPAIRALGETEVSDHFTQLPEGVASGLLDQEDPQNEAVLPDESPELDLNLENVIDQAFEKAGLPSDVTTDQLIDQAVTEVKAEEDDFAALIEQGIAVTEQLIAGLNNSDAPTIPGTIEMDIEQDDGSIKHHVFDNPDRIGHVVAMAQCDALIKQYDQQKLEQATKPPVKPLRIGWFSWL